MITRTRLAAAWAVLFALPHIYWGVGFDLGLRTALADEIVDRADLTFRLGNLAIAAFCLTGAAVAVGLGRKAADRGRYRWVPYGMLVGLTWFGAVLLTLRALDIWLEFGLGLTGVTAIPPERHAEFIRLSRWFLFLWLPWFGLGAVAWTRAAVAASKRRAAPLRDS